MLFPVSSESVDYCSTMIVVVRVSNFRLAPDALGDDPVDGEGHWHLMDSGVQLAATGDTWYPVPADEPLSAGRLFFTAELVDNNHQSFDPKIQSNLVEFNVADGPDCVGGAGPDAAAKARAVSAPAVSAPASGGR